MMHIPKILKSSKVINSMERAGSIALSDEESKTYSEKKFTIKKRDINRAPVGTDMINDCIDKLELLL